MNPTVEVNLKWRLLELLRNEKGSPSAIHSLTSYSFPARQRSRSSFAFLGGSVWESIQ